MTPSTASALFPGHVTHARLRPRTHNLAYRISSLLLDLDELDALNQRLRLFSVDRFNVFSFFRSDRGDRSGRPLREQIESHMRDAGLSVDGGPIRVLTMPRVLGWSFNPLSVFFCYRRTGDINAVLWEVDNTFGQRHGYLIPAAAANGRELRQRCDKNFYVSPFMDMDLVYDFRVRLPGNTFSIIIQASDTSGLMFTACHTGRRVELTDGALLRLFLTLPYLTLKVTGGIAWEALKLWSKGIAIRRKPPPPTEPVSIVKLASSSQKVFQS
jgi:uncharacterized protein